MRRVGRPAGEEHGPVLRVRKVPAREFIVPVEDDLTPAEIDRRFQARLAEIRRQGLYRLNVEGV